MTRKTSVSALVRELIDSAQRAPARRASRSLVGGHESALRQTVVTLLADAGLAEHETPGAATLYVLSGRVRLDVAGESWEARGGDLLDIPARRHAVQALEDAALLLTTVPQDYARRTDDRKESR